MTDEHPKKTITIVVNGRPRTVAKDELSFDELVRLAFENPPSGPNVVFTGDNRGEARRNDRGMRDRASA